MSNDIEQRSSGWRDNVYIVEIIRIMVILGILFLIKAVMNGWRYVRKHTTDSNRINERMFFATNCPVLPIAR